MDKRISDPDSVLQQLEQIEARGVRFCQLLDTLEKTARRFKEFEDSYEHIQIDFQEIKNLADRVGTEHDEASRVLASVRKEGKQIRPTLDTELTRLREELVKAREDNRRELRLWLSSADKSIDSYAKTLHGLEQKVEQAVSRLGEALDKFENSARERADRALEGLRLELSEWKKKFEDEQFRKLDHVIQTYNLVDGRVKSYEGRVDNVEKFFAEVSGELGKTVQGLVSQVTEQRKVVDQTLENLRMALGALGFLALLAIGLAAYAIWKLRVAP